jgi:glycine/D-amino acid oxidase-like deaminating enzyme
VDLASNEPDVVVVGGGIVAATCALALSSRGLSVLAITDRGASATEASGAMLGELGEFVRVPATAAERLEAELRLRAAAVWPAWADEAGVAPGRLQAGTFVYASPDRARDELALAAIEQAAADNGRPAERVAPGDVPGLDPSPACLPTRALFLPEERWIDAPALLRDVWAAAEASDRVRREEGHVVAVETRGGAVTGVRRDDGLVSTGGVVVLCAGAGTGPLLAGTPELAEAVPQILPAKGVGLQLRLPARLGEMPRLSHVIRSPNRDFACGLHLVPRDGGLYLGATNRATRWRGITGAVTAGEVLRLVASAERELLRDCARWDIVTGHWGERPLAADGLPVAGATPLDGLFVATGTYRNGVLLAPLLADVVAETITGGSPMPELGVTAQRCPPARSALEALRDGLRDYAALLQDPDGPPLLPQLAELLPTIGSMTWDQSPEAAAARDHVTALLTAFPLVEMVPEAIIEACHPELLP